jgi:hypothetical protein
MEAVKLHPFLQNFIDKKATSPKITTPEIKTSIRHFNKNLMFIYLSYQGWHCTIASPVLVSSEAITTLCTQIIALQHKIHPFPIAPLTAHPNNA